ncbi:hypothetical protein [Pseudomonas sp. JUb42]|uniref:hypothetical protein n=1 Tax=Pseudomonas sp. JUb42 TaxID=2940611 RepID=UPI0021680210|nr:hypothetical protein [Pseudomonas sp. JUb42]
MYRISAAILTLFILMGCTHTPAQRPDFSQLPQDVFTPVFKKVRGHSGYQSGNLGAGYKLSFDLIRDKRREEIEELFHDNAGVCNALYSDTLMNCVVTRLWTYSNPVPSPERYKGCEPGMQLLYSFYFDHTGQLTKTRSKFDFKALHLLSCPGKAPVPDSGG